MASEPIDIFQKMRVATEEARLEADSAGLRYRAEKRRAAGAASESHFYSERYKIAEQDSRRLEKALRAVWGDLEAMHEPGCARVGVGCRACETQALIEECL